jgi:hypothetical protein
MGLFGLGVDLRKLGLGWWLALVRVVALSIAMFVIGVALWDGGAR